MYNTWISILHQKFRRHSGPIKSTLHKIDCRSNVEQIVSQKGPLAIGVKTRIGKQIVKKLAVSEVLIFSTFWTNNQKLELFVLMVSGMDVGFPVATLFLKNGNGEGLKTRKDTLKNFCQTAAHVMPRL